MTRRDFERLYRDVEELYLALGDTPDADAASGHAHRKW